MNIVIGLLMTLAGIAFLGALVYTALAAWFMMKNIAYGAEPSRTRREMWRCIPSKVRKLGFVSIATFLACLLLLALTGLISG